ncbi:MAG: methyltransferase MtaB domain-containing protein, partial [Rhodothermales bacterium]|nr:methyltransferase MtaB domain-containing protein [Rhodothermales bacterium]
RCPRPVTPPGGLVIGDGSVYPELNFTLPAMQILESTMPEVRAIYSRMIDDACVRAFQLHVPGLVVEFELLPELTREPSWGAEVTALLRERLDRFEASHGLKSVLRVTPNDVREFERPPLLRRGPLWESMIESFDRCAGEGATLLSIESTGGKELHDDALLYGDLETAVFSLGVLGSRDMRHLWTNIVEIAENTGTVAAGDTACGFANTAMTLAQNKYIPSVWAAVDRVMTVPRSLVAFECGAIGPSKDCAYEGPYLKAITGCPISLEGSEAACAHSSPIGNIARAVADLWSNESIQDVQLLGGPAPSVSLEQLAYAARLMNTATEHGADQARILRDLFAASDASLDPQAFILRPDVVLQLSKEIVEEATAYTRTRRAAIGTLAVLREAIETGELSLSTQEQKWLDRLSQQADDLPEDEEQFIGRMVSKISSDSVRLEEYDLATRAVH